MTDWRSVTVFSRPILGFHGHEALTVRIATRARVAFGRLLSRRRRRPVRLTRRARAGAASPAGRRRSSNRSGDHSPHRQTTEPHRRVTPGAHGRQSTESHRYSHTDTREVASVFVPRRRWRRATPQSSAHGRLRLPSIAGQDADDHDVVSRRDGIEATATTRVREKTFVRAAVTGPSLATARRDSDQPSDEPSAVPWT